MTNKQANDLFLCVASDWSNAEVSEGGSQLSLSKKSSRLIRSKKKILHSVQWSVRQFRPNVEVEVDDMTLEEAVERVEADRWTMLTFRCS